LKNTRSEDRRLIDSASSEEEGGSDYRAKVSLEDKDLVEAVSTEAAGQQNLARGSLAPLLRSLTLETEAEPVESDLSQADDAHLESLHDKSPLIDKNNKNLHEKGPLPVSEVSATGDKSSRRLRNREKRRRKGHRRRGKKRLRNGDQGGQQQARVLLLRRYQAKRQRQQVRRRRLNRKNASLASTERPKKKLPRNRRRQLGAGLGQLRMRRLWAQSQKYQAWRRQKSQEQLLAQPAAQLAIEQLWQGLFRQGDHWKQIYQVDNVGISGIELFFI